MKTTFIETPDSKNGEFSLEVMKRVSMFEEALELYSSMGINLEKDKFYTSIAPNNDDIIEFALFKAAMYQDQESFSVLVSSDKMDSQVKDHVLGNCVWVACLVQDINVLKFLIKNEVEIINLITIDDDSSLAITSSINAVLEQGINEVLVALLFEQGLDLSRYEGNSTVYYNVIELAPEEFLLEEFNYCIVDVNEIQSELHSHFAPDGKETTELFFNSYLIQALENDKFQLAAAFIMKGANVNYINSNGNSLLFTAIMLENIEMVQLLLVAGAIVDVMSAKSAWFSCISQNETKKISC